MNISTNYFLNGLGDWNPQLFRELTGRFTRKNLAIALGVSGCVQVLIYLFYIGSLPERLAQNPYNRYCTGLYDEGYSHSTYQCLAEGMNWVINWQLWHFDLFVGLSIVGMGILLIIGSHLITADLAKEEKRGTLSFVRLSPQPVQKIILGKLLGVPSLLYVGVAAALPFHLIAGLNAKIALPWIGMVYLMAIAACGTVYGLAALWSFIGQELLGGFQAWLYSGTLSLYLFAVTMASFSGGVSGHTPFNWLRLFYPGNIFYYLTASNSLDPQQINYFMPMDWFDTTWYNSTAWVQGGWGLGVMFAHYGILAWVTWQGLKRRFYDPNATIISKKMSYGIVAIAAVGLAGFADGTEDYLLYNNVETLQLFYFAMFLGLSLLLTPPRQRVQDWARFRHQGRFGKKLWLDLLWGERSPALGAIAVNLVLATAWLMLVVLNSPLLDDQKYYATANEGVILMGGLLLQMGMLFILACFVQWMFLRRQKQALWLWVTLGGLTTVPFFIFLIFQNRFSVAIAFGLLSPFPLTAIAQAPLHLVFSCLAAQWLAIAGCIAVLHRRIKHLGTSELKTLLTDPTVTSENMLS